VTLIRKRIAEFCEKESPFKGEIEVDESYFGGKRIKGKRGRGAYKKTPVFGIFKRGGKVYTEVVPDCAKATLQAIIQGRVDLDSIIHSDGWRGYNGLVDLGYKKHYRLHHGEDQFANGRSHINWIESFWVYAKGRAMDNIMVERLWRTVKYEEIYLRDYENVKDLKQHLKTYFDFYNSIRPHQTFGGKTPSEIYWGESGQKRAA